MQKYSGKVKWFNADKGFGFLARDGHPEDLAPKCGVFVHYDSIERVAGLEKKMLVKDQLVEFYVVTSEKGLKALHVSFVDMPAEDEG